MGDRDVVSLEDERLLAVAIAIADGTPVEWPDTSPGSSSQSHGAALALRLRALERIVRGHDAVIGSFDDHPSGDALLSTDTLLTEARRRAAPHAEDDLRVEWGPLIVLDKIGRGSVGDVYRAWDPRLEREVALKLVNATSPAVTTPAFDEGRLLARIRHPNVVTVYGAERVNNRVGIWMEYVRGRTLADEIADQGAVTAEEAARIGIEVCRALSAVHGAGLLHRDVKAQNVMRDHDGRIVLGDFGTGMVFDENASLVEAQIAGTPLYLAPEILRGQPPSAATDVYSVGVLLYFLVTGQYPIRGRTLKELRRAHEAGNRVPLRQARPDLPSDFIDIVDALIEPGPDRRYGTAASAEAALSSWLAEKSADTPAIESTPPHRRYWWLAAAGAILAAIAVASTPPVRNRLSFWQRGLFTTAGGPISRQLTNMPCSGAASDDGRWIACAESVANFRARGAPAPALILIAPEAGTNRILREPGPKQRVSAAIISPDGTSVAFVLLNAGTPEIRIIGVDGTGERLVHTVPPDIRGVGLNSWSPGDDRIAVRIWRKNQTQAVALLTPSTGALDVVFELAQIPQFLHRSPDGRYLAFDVIQSEGAPERDIRVCDLQSGTCEMAVSHPANDLAPNWAPDGSLFFMSDRSGTMGLWAVERDGVHPWASTELIRDTGRGVPTVRGFGGGSMFYDLRVNDFDVYSAVLTGSADQPPAPVRLSPRAVDRNMTPVWSPDGKTVAYISSRGPYTERGGMRLVIQSLEDGREREVRYDLPASMTRLAWSPDGKRIAMRTIKGGTLPGGIFGIHVVDAATGEFVTSLRRNKPAEEYVEDQITDLAWRDNDTILFASKAGLNEFVVSTGAERSVWSTTPEAIVHGMALSRDASRAVALQTDREEKQWVRVVMVPLAGGDVRNLLQVSVPEVLWIQDWTTDDQNVLVARWDRSKAPAERRAQLWRLPVDGTEAQPLPLAMPGLRELRLHPDGQRVVFTAGAPTSEFWMLSGIGK